MPWYGKGYNDGPEDNVENPVNETLRKENNELSERVKELEKENRKLKKKNKKLKQEYSIPKESGHSCDCGASWCDECGPEWFRKH